MEAKHTPGPWRVGPTDDTIVTARGDTLASLFGEYEREWERMEADARLIAAAPDLLKALEEIFTASRPIGPTRLAWIKARAAITKAKGV